MNKRSIREDKVDSNDVVNAQTDLVGDPAVASAESQTDALMKTYENLGQSSWKE